MEKFVRDPQLKRLLDVKSDSTLWRMRKKGQLPKPRKINGANVTLQSEVEAALERLFEGDAA